MRQHLKLVCAPVREARQGNHGFRLLGCAVLLYSHKAARDWSLSSFCSACAPPSVNACNIALLALVELVQSSWCLVVPALPPLPT